MWQWVTKLFGGSDKGIIEQVSDVADKWVPSATTQHKMGIEDLKAGDDSQASARAMELRSHDTWVDVVVDALNRLVRPLMTYWVVLLLWGLIKPPDLSNIPPMLWNIIWTVITFWFGSRMLFKDIPALVQWLKEKK